MIELRARVIRLPAVCIVAVIAGTSKFDFLEGPAVLIGVTAIAAAVGQPFELSILLTGPRSVALLAGFGLMQSREREVRGAMIEPASRLKAIHRVAAQAIGAQLALMLILMTCRALTAKSKERPVQIFLFDLGAGAGWNLVDRMTVPAFLLLMLTGQGKAGLGEVVEFLAVQTNQRGSLSLVFLMTAPAIRFAGRAFVGTSVKPRLGFHPAPDLGVTLQTFETARGGGKFVTGPAFGQTFQLLVSA